MSRLNRIRSKREQRGSSSTTKLLKATKFEELEGGCRSSSNLSRQGDNVITPILSSAVLFAIFNHNYMVTKVCFDCWVRVDWCRNT